MSRRLSAIIMSAVLGVLLVTAAGCGNSDGGSSEGSRSDGGSSGGRDVYKVGILQLSEAELLDGIVASFEQTFREEMRPKKVEFKVLNAQGDNSLIQSIAAQLHQGDSNLFAVAGTPGIIALAAVERDRPIIGLAMTDPVQAKVANSVDASGNNVTGSLGYIPPAQVLDTVQRMQPPPKTVGTLYDASNEASRIWIADFKRALRPTDLKLKEATITGPGDVAAAARSLSGRADTWVIPPDTTVAAGLPAVGSAADASGAAVFVTAGDPQTPGILASVGPDYAALGGLAGGVAAKVAKGADPSTTPFVKPDGATVVPNPERAKDLGVTLPDSGS